tara:strand:+ start:5961 stop:6809 length:849 start_codon:yes stop_codon:yes gene_type:complete
MILIDKELLNTINEEVKTIVNNIGHNNVLIHSDIKHLFLFEFNSKTDLLEKHLRNINEIFSNFNIWMPTFNYDFTKKGVYNIENDKSQVGVLNNYFRSICDWRTTTPVFNFCGNGNYPIEEIYPLKEINPFIYGSEFHYLYRSDSIHCHYGSDFSNSTLIHYVENISKKLLYRYSKIFNGVVYQNGITTKVFLDYHVTPLNPRVEYDWKKIQSDLINNKLMHTFYIFDSINYINLFSIKNVVDFWVDNLQIDPFYFLEEDSKNWIIPKIEEMGRGFELNDFE